MLTSPMVCSSCWISIQMLSALRPRCERESLELRVPYDTLRLPFGSTWHLIQVTQLQYVRRLFTESAHLCTVLEHGDQAYLVVLEH
ncbi:hypothetical protein BC628DRAFT_1101367 [Trametes gibbosa]|nr:hypothetical protein BC628DRAFT_1101367 [Trametes gibbosa]